MLQCEVRGVRDSDGKNVCLRGPAASLEAAVEQAVRRGIRVKSLQVTEPSADRPQEPSASGSGSTAPAPRPTPRWLATLGQVAFGGLVATSALLLFQWGRLPAESASITVAATPAVLRPVAPTPAVTLPVTPAPARAPIVVAPPPAPPAAPDPGYERGSDGSQHWMAGRRHPQFPHITSTATEGQWRADPGYRFPSSDSLAVRWTPDVVHPESEHVRASQQADAWHPEAGYAWVDAQSSTDFRVRWVVGCAHPSLPHLVSDSTAGVWTPAPGYTWANDKPGDFTVVKKGPTDQQFQQAFEQFAGALICHATAKASEGSALGDLLAEAARTERNKGIHQAVSCLFPDESPRAIQAVTRVLVKGLEGQLTAREWMSSDGRAWLVQQLREADPDMADAYPVAEAVARLLAR